MRGHIRNDSFLTAGQDGGVGRHASPLPAAMRRITANLKTKNAQDFQKSQTVWKSDNQGFEEAICIQVGWRGGDRELRQRGCGMAQRGGADDVIKWSNSHVWWIRIRRDTCGASHPSHRPDHTPQGSSTRKRKPHKFWLSKPVGVGMAEETACYSGESV